MRGILGDASEEDVVKGKKRGVIWYCVCVKRGLFGTVCVCVCVSVFVCAIGKEREREVNRKDEVREERIHFLTRCPDEFWRRFLTSS